MAHLNSIQSASYQQFIPRFSKNQLVYFFGGVGKIKNYQPNSKSWAYTVEMEMGPLPEMGRVGFETTILLQEADIHATLNY